MTEILKKCDSEIITAARGWISTPFHHQGRQKGAGVDCLGLLVGVATELQLCDKVGRPLNEFDELNYGHLPDEKRLYNQLQQLLQRVERPKAGAIGLFKVEALIYLIDQKGFAVTI